MSAIATTPVAAAIASDTVWIPLGFYAVVVVAGRDATETERTIESVKGVSSNESVFTLPALTPFVVPAGSLYLDSVSVGTGTLTITADAAAANEQIPDVPITDTLTVVVYRVATQLVVYFTEAGSTNELRVPVIAGFVTLQLPINTTATIRVEGQDAAGTVVPLTTVAFQMQGGEAHLVATADPAIVTLVPDTNGSGTFKVTADGDPSPGAASLSVICSVSLHSFLRPTHLTETYSVAPK